MDGRNRSAAGWLSRAPLQARARGLPDPGRRPVRAGSETTRNPRGHRWRGSFLLRIASWLLLKWSGSLLRLVSGERALDATIGNEPDEGDQDVDRLGNQRQTKRDGDG